MSDQARRRRGIGAMVLVIVAVTVHAVVLFRLSARLAVPVAAAVVGVAVAAHLGAGRWLLRRRRGERG